MTTHATVAKTEKTLDAQGFRLHVTGLSLSLSLFLLALLPRAYDLQRFVTADEAKWVYRSAQFLAALLRGDFPATSVNLTPAVTTTWLGSLGLAGYYQFNQATINRPFFDWLISLPEFRVELAVLSATRWPMVILTSLSVVVIYLLLGRLFNPTLAFLAAAFIALDPHFLALSRIIGHDAPTAVFMTISILLLLLDSKGMPAMRGREEMEKTASPPHFFASAPLLLSGVAAGLAFLSKAPALFLIPLAGLVFIFSEPPFFRLSPRLTCPRMGVASSLPRLLLWLATAYLTFVILWPAAWVDPVGRPLAVFQNAFLSATDQEEADAEGYWRVPELGPFYYVVNGAFKLSPLVMAGAGLAVIFLVRQRISVSANSEAVNGELAAKQSKPPFTLAPLFWLIAFVLLFTLFITASDKRSARYILPAF
ncbi:MAG TPA: phospholipid carrier-dependent glycosyltransferase, partial [Anaerolineae bacterium]|nr:phospholipid carrier-dependent glycosyltransferase [Anaerolineae bacterium]